MFTGIITAVGKIVALDRRGEDMRMRIGTGRLDLGDVALGDSIAVSGVCLTVVDLPGDGFWADVSGETLSRSSLGQLAAGDSVNLDVELIEPVALEQGSRFAIREGGLTVGAGVITKIYED